jgi:hypothetical protein
VLENGSSRQNPTGKGLGRREPLSSSSRDPLLCVLFALFLPSHFWTEVISTIVYLINVQPSSRLQGKCPRKVLHGSSPRYAHLRVFGCTCYVLLPSHECTKLIAQSIECVFLGYSLEHKDYHCYDPSAHRIRISRDVTFVKNRPYFYSSTPSPSTSVESLSFLFLPPISILSPDFPIENVPPSEIDPPPPTPPPLHLHKQNLQLSLLFLFTIIVVSKFFFLLPSLN